MCRPFESARGHHTKDAIQDGSRLLFEGLVRAPVRVRCLSMQLFKCKSTPLPALDLRIAELLDALPAQLADHGAGRFEIGADPLSEPIQEHLRLGDLGGPDPLAADRPPGPNIMETS